MFLKNQRVIIEDNKIISNQNRSTPGIYKIFDVKPNTSYEIELIGYNKGNSEHLLWISDINDRRYKINGKKIVYHNGIYKRIKVGILFISKHVNKYFYLSDIKLFPENTYRNNDKISLIIPCLYIHFKYIIPLLLIYEEQTLLPDEVVVVIAESKKVSKEMIEKLRNMEFKFSTKIIEIREKSFAGNTRLVGLRNSKNSIIVFQDADDIPHKQRLEMIMYYFGRYPYIVHICHKWSKKPQDFEKSWFNISKTKYIVPKNNIFITRYRKIEHLANGNLSIRRVIFPKINWFCHNSRKQDILTNIDIYNKYRKTLFIREEIYLYRCENSSNLINQKPTAD